MAVETLFENSDYLIINKPFDMYINSDDEKEKNTVTYHIAKTDSHKSCSSQPLHFVQRLDYATSGVLCIAKNRSAAAVAGRAFEKRLTKKYYVAIVRGHVEVELADVEYDVGMESASMESNHRMCVLTASSSMDGCVSARSARTRVLLLETGWYDGDKVAVVLLKPITGRRHQLRVHCLSIGHTILGDYTYSDTVDTTPHRMFLHATRLVLPVENQTLDIQTSLPFFSDERFTSKWKPDRCWYKYKTKEDFIKACDVIDMSYVIGAKYQLFNTNKT